MRSTWDAAKNRLNLRRHGIAFEDATRIFDGPVEKLDDRLDYGEIRIYAVGLLNGVEITVIYTDRKNDTRHLISAWKSAPHEKRAFWEELAGQAD
ncbi:MAG: BrnT family toxin [Candidatus Korobacteraceae bacterium]